MVRFTFLSVAGCTLLFASEAGVLSVTILLAMEAEWTFLGSSSGGSGLPLILLVGGVRVELPESILFVGPLFLLGHGLDGHFVLFIQGEESPYRAAATAAAAFALALR